MTPEQALSNLGRAVRIAEAIRATGSRANPTVRMLVNEIASLVSSARDVLSASTDTDSPVGPGRQAELDEAVSGLGGPSDATLEFARAAIRDTLAGDLDPGLLPGLDEVTDRVLAVAVHFTERRLTIPEALAVISRDGTG